MKRILFLLTALFLFTAGSPHSFAAEKEHTTSPKMSQQKEQYKKSMEERLAKIGKELDKLKARAGTMAVEARKDVNKYLAEAERKQKAAMRKLDEMRTASARRWKKFTAEMDKAADEFEKAFERAKSHFKE